VPGVNTMRVSLGNLPWYERQYAGVASTKVIAIEMRWKAALRSAKICSEIRLRKTTALETADRMIGEIVSWRHEGA
jgi:hypothetical protein